MIELVTFWVPGEPRSKGRPRFSRGEDGSAHVFTDRATKDGESAIANAAVFASPFLEPSERPIKVEATFYLYRRNRRDLDNMAKLILDALNGVVYVDDEQVVSLSVVKKRAALKDEAGTSIRVTAFPGEDHSHWPIVPASEKASRQSADTKFPGATVADQRAVADVSESLQKRILKTLREEPDVSHAALAEFLGLPAGVVRSIAARAEADHLRDANRSMSECGWSDE